MKILLFSVIFFIISFVATYFSMYTFSHDISASCMKCLYIEDVFVFSIFNLPIVIIILFIINKLINNKNIMAVIILLLFVILVFFNNYNIFIDRVSAWSSYSFQESLLNILFQSYPYIILGSIMVILLFYKLYKK